MTTPPKETGQGADKAPIPREVQPPSPPREGDDPVAVAILSLIAARGAEASISPTDAARAFAQDRAKPTDPPDLWRKYLPAVRQQALHLARQQRIAILRKGKAVDPHAPIRGLVRLATARPYAPEPRGDLEEED